MGHLEAADAMVEQLKVFSENEHFTEHSTESLRYLLIPAHRADLQVTIATTQQLLLLLWRRRRRWPYAPTLLLMSVSVLPNVSNLH